MVPRFGFQGVGTFRRGGFGRQPRFLECVCSAWWAKQFGIRFLPSNQTQENNRHVAPGLISCVKALPASSSPGCVLGWARKLAATASGEPSCTPPGFGRPVGKMMHQGIGVRWSESDL